MREGRIEGGEEGEGEKGIEGGGEGERGREGGRKVGKEKCEKRRRKVKLNVAYPLVLDYRLQCHKNWLLQNHQVQPSR